MYRFNEESCSIIFNALRHEDRRKILRILSKGNVSFTKLYETLGISSSHLTYHLDVLDGLIYKTHSDYTLSSYGRTVINMIDKKEPPTSPEKLYKEKNIFKPLMVVILIAFVIVSGQYIKLFQINVAQTNALGEKDSTIATLYEELEMKMGSSELDIIIQRQPSIRLTSFYTLKYHYSLIIEPQEACKDSILVLYAPQDKLTLQLEFMHYIPDGLYLPLTIQKGKALRYDICSKDIWDEATANRYQEWSPIIWSRNVTNVENKFEILLKNKGWYTISLTGPIRVLYKSGPYVNYCGWGDKKYWISTEPIRVWANCRLVKNGEIVLFGIETAKTTYLKYIG